MINQIQTFGYSCIFGVILGAMYDVFRIMRLAVNFKEWGIFIQDILYFTISGICTFLFALAYNYGEIRFYIIAGGLIGWIVYYMTIGEIVYRFSDKILNLVRKIIKKVWRVIFRPMVFIFNKIKVIMSKIRDKKGKDIQSSNKI